MNEAGSVNLSALRKYGLILPGCAHAVGLLFAADASNWSRVDVVASTVSEDRTHDLRIMRPTPPAALSPHLVEDECA
jgi:hypothetical protein